VSNSTVATGLYTIVSNAANSINFGSGYLRRVQWRWLERPRLSGNRLRLTKRRHLPGIGRVVPDEG